MACANFALSNTEKRPGHIQIRWNEQENRCGEYDTNPIERASGRCIDSSITTPCERSAEPEPEAEADAEVEVVDGNGDDELVSAACD